MSRCAPDTSRTADKPIDPALLPLVEALARAAARRDYAAALVAQGRLNETPDVPCLQPSTGRRLRTVLD